MTNQTSTPKRNRLKNGQCVKRIAFLTTDNCYINIDVSDLDFSDLRNGESLMQWLYAQYLQTVHAGKIIKDFRWGDESFAEAQPYKYQEYVGYSFHGDTGGYAQWKD